VFWFSEVASSFLLQFGIGAWGRIAPTTAVLSKLPAGLFVDRGRALGSDRRGIPDVLIARSSAWRLARVSTRPSSRQ
jgi:hypothetical protein